MIRRIRSKKFESELNFETKDIYNDLCDHFRKSGRYEELTTEASKKAIFLQDDLDGMFKVAAKSKYVHIIHTTFYSRPSEWILHDVNEYKEWLDDYSEAYL